MNNFLTHDAMINLVILIKFEETFHTTDSILPRRRANRKLEIEKSQFRIANAVIVCISRSSTGIVVPHRYSLSRLHSQTLSIDATLAACPESK